MDEMMKEVGKRNYIGDDGERYVVVEMKPVVEAKSLDSKWYTGFGASEFRLEGNGLLYEQSEDDVFKIATTGVIIRPL